jgi:hypothetical protein
MTIATVNRTDEGIQKDVIAELKWEPRVNPAAVRVQWDALLVPEQIEVTVAKGWARAGNEAVLKGTVRSWAEREEAERAAWRAPGVTSADNRTAIAVV